MLVPDHSAEREIQALLICPDRGKAGELMRLLGPQAASVVIRYLYPSGAALIGLLNTLRLTVCLVDADSDRDAALRLIAEINARAPALPIVALLGGSNPELILRCLRQGASEFLIQPFSLDQWQAVWERIGRAQPAQSAEKLGRLILVAPGKGASGATTVAANLAFQLKRAGNQKVLLADLDPLTGSIAFMLKLKSSYSFLDALTHADRLDEDLWRALVNPCQGVDVLLSPEEPLGSGEDWDPAALVGYCQRHYDVAVVDAAGLFGEWNLSLARLANERLLVTTSELPALHAAQRALGYLEDNGIQRDRLRIVVNRYAAERSLAPEAIQEALGCPLFHILPNDYESLQKAVMEGKPVSAGSRFGKAMVELAEKLGGKATPRREGSLLSLLFKKR